MNCDILICLIAFALKALERLEGIDHIGSPHLEQGPTSKCLAKALWKDYGLNTLHIYLWEYRYESYTSRLSIEAKADLLVDRADTGGLYVNNAINAASSNVFVVSSQKEAKKNPAFSSSPSRQAASNLGDIFLLSSSVNGILLVNHQDLLSQSAT